MNTEKISFEIISNAGQARNIIYNALDFIRDKKYKEAEDRIKQAEAMILKAHEFHVNMVSEEAKGNTVPVDLLLVHAMNILLVAESERDMSKKIMEIDMERSCSKKG